MTSTAQRKEWKYQYITCCSVLYDKAERGDQRRPVVCGARKRERKIETKEEFRQEYERERMKKREQL